MWLAIAMHDKQKDKGGAPYILHPIHVAEQMKTEEETIVALLHDVVEDTSVTLSDLQYLGFSDEVVYAVDAITKRDGEKWKDYIDRVKENRIARKVKIADLNHNSDLSRLCRPPTHDDLLRAERYKKAIIFLQSAKKL